VVGETGSIEYRGNTITGKGSSTSGTNRFSWDGGQRRRAMVMVVVGISVQGMEEEDNPPLFLGALSLFFMWRHPSLPW